MKLSLKYLFLLFLPIIFYSFIRSNKNNFFQNSYKKNYNNQGIIGVWKTKNNDLKVEVFEVNGTIYGRLVDFLCNHKEKLPLIDHKDVKNPDPKNRNRSWLNTIVLFGLKKNGSNKFSGGFIYDLNNGKTYNASITFNNNIITVRAYWGIAFFGKSLVFEKVH